MYKHETTRTTMNKLATFFNLTIVSMSICTHAVDPPTMHTLNTLKDGTDKISLIDVMSPEWETVGDLLGMKPCIIETIKADRNGKVKMCCRDLLVKWMKSPSDLIYPFSWDSVVQLLLDLGLNSQVKTVNKILGVE